MRHEHEADTRAKSVSLTDRGKALMDKVVPLVEQIDGGFFAKVSQNEQHSLRHILKKLGE